MFNWRRLILTSLHKSNKNTLLCKEAKIIFLTICTHTHNTGAHISIQVSGSIHQYTFNIQTSTLITNTCCHVHPCTIHIGKVWSSGAHPTEKSSIKHQIQFEYTCSHFPSGHSGHNEILHIPRQLFCLGMCNISLWWDKFSYKPTAATIYFFKIGIGSKCHMWHWCKVWGHCINELFIQCLNSSNEKGSIKAHSVAFYPYVSHFYSVYCMPDTGKCLLDLVSTISKVCATNEIRKVNSETCHYI